MVPRTQYPEEEQQEKIRNENIAKFQEQKALLEPAHIKDNSIFSRVLKIMAIIALIITLVLACIVLFGSADENMYLDKS